MLVSLLTASCSGGDASGEIRFLVFGDPAELQAFRSVVTEFRKVEPDVTVSLVEASDRDDLIARLSTSFAGGQPPDLFLINYRFFGQFAARGVLEPIDERLQGSDAFEEEDFYADSARGVPRRRRAGLPAAEHLEPRRLLQQEPLQTSRCAVARAGWTWDQMVEKAIALTRDADADGNVDVYGLGVEPTIIRIAPFVWSNGGEIVDDELAPSRFTLDTPAAQEAMQRFFDLRQLHLVVPTEEEIESEDDESRFLNGRTAMVLSSRRATPTFRTIDDFDWDVAPLPRLRQPAGILHSDAYCMTRASEEKDAAWRFMEFALGPEGQRDHRALGTDGPVADRGLAVEGVPRPERQAGQLARLPGHDPLRSVASRTSPRGPRSRTLRRASSRAGCTRASGAAWSLDSSTSAQARCSTGPSADALWRDWPTRASTRSTAKSPLSRGSTSRSWTASCSLSSARLARGRARRFGSQPGWKR